MMISWAGRAASEPSARVAVTLAGQVFREVVRLELSRDLSDLAGSFTVELRDAARSMAALAWTWPAPERDAILPAERVEIAIDGEPYFVGWIDQVRPVFGESQINAQISGRDVTGDLVDCAAAPRGPTEYRNLKLDAFAARLCQPFSIRVRAEVDVGAAFDKLTIDPSETVLSAIEKYARRRQVLIVSDGVGTLLLTRSGQSRAPAGIAIPPDAFQSQGQFDVAQRFSDYFVKGSAGGGGGRRAPAPRLLATAEPLDDAPLPPAPASSEDTDQGGSEGGGVRILGHARDPGIKRWRPTVLQGRTEMTQAEAQRFAEWKMRNNRGKGIRLDCSAKDFRGRDGGAPGGLWRVNQLVSAARDRYAGIDRDMLIAGLTMTYDDRGDTTQFRLCDPAAYDPEPPVSERARGGGRSRRGGGGSGGGAAPRLDGTARPL
jgi:prophage tail gpP-like protein